MEAIVGVLYSMYMCVCVCVCERERRLRFYGLQLTSPQDKGVQNMINFPSRTATCKNHVVLPKGISSMDNKDESSASAKYSALPAEIFTFNPSHLTDSFTCT